MNINLDEVEYRDTGVYYQDRKVKPRSRLWVAIRKAQAGEDNRPGGLEAAKDAQKAMKVHHYKMVKAVRPARVGKTVKTARSGRNDNHGGKLYQDPNG